MGPAPDTAASRPERPGGSAGRARSRGGQAAAAARRDAGAPGLRRAAAGAGIGSAPSGPAALEAPYVRSCPCGVLLVFLPRRILESSGIGHASETPLRRRAG